MSQYEVEMKFAVSSFDEFLSAASGLGAEFGNEQTQSDRYFNHPERDFGETDEALRVRTAGDRNRVTYKGPVLDRSVKLREEIELPIGRTADDGNQFAAILIALSFREVRTVTKHRRTAHLEWQGRAFELTLDRVEGLGLFVEVETVADEEAKLAARDALLELTAALGVSRHEPRSYLQMLLESDEPA